MFLEVVYKPTTLFSLKRSEATNSAGKSLISPSPYSIKMALLNAIITYDSIETAKKHFPLIRDLSISFRLPSEIIVNNCLIKILKDNDKVSPSIRKIMPFKSTVAFREYIFLNDIIRILLKVNKESYNNSYDFLTKWFAHINYFGKKGCFFQYIRSRKFSRCEDIEQYSSELGENFIRGIIFQMDDMNNKMQFDDINNYSSKRVKREKKFFVFPYEQVSSNKNYTFFTKIE